MEEQWGQLSVRRKKPAGALWPDTSAWCFLASGVTSAHGRESLEDGKLKNDRHKVMASTNGSRDRDYIKGAALN